MYFVLWREGSRKVQQFIPEISDYKCHGPNSVISRWNFLSAKAEFDSKGLKRALVANLKDVCPAASTIVS